MNLETLAERIGYELHGEHPDAEVAVVTSNGEECEILSLNWDRENDRWVIVCE